MGSELMMGNVIKTSRGFEAVEFEDAYGASCSLQQSSGIGDYADSLQRPGSSFVWLGVNDGEPKILKSEAEAAGLELPEGEEISGWMPYPIPDNVLITTRMHLNREQVHGLVARLNQWLSTGRFS